ncbi:MAG: exodeoxyribonuclease III [Synergistaceae bacterium]|nr:exodeoxyribonuclease III [Synergistaceae bacterium]MBQ9897092.1 exodeoxyribonuclease III [Synergistaceae bacterium]MBR0097495.1 exodeoxyribonuclease III [Synergistaceae bacterium]MBR0221309.1 exodeoxyribonuclease III [Synergistaceae bacterium]
MMFKIASFNVNSVRSRLHILERWLPVSMPDLLFMQETKVVNDLFPVQNFHDLGYEVYFNGEKSYNGVALAAKKILINKISNINFGFNDNLSPNFETRVMTLEFDNISILHTYVPQGKLITHPDYILKQEFLKRVKKIIEQKINDKFMWLGDLNVAPTELDVAHPETKLRSVCFAPEIRECFNAAMQGLTDLFRKFNPGREIYSFFDYRIKDALKNNTGWRVDNILASPKLAELAANSFIDQEPRTWEKPSDHTPLIAEFNF